MALEYNKNHKNYVFGSQKVLLFVDKKEFLSIQAYKKVN